METDRTGQVFYPEDADRLAPEGCVALGNEHGACLDRGCRRCLVYYHGPQALADDSPEDTEIWIDDFNSDYDF